MRWIIMSQVEDFSISGALCLCEIEVNSKTGVTLAVLMFRSAR